MALVAGITCRTCLLGRPHGWRRTWKEHKIPVLVAGDLNTTSSDNTPTSIRNEIMTRVTDYQFWV